MLRLGLSRPLSRLGFTLSKYSINLGSAIYTALAGVPSAQPAAVAGYWANREFFYNEFQHFLSVAKEYDTRRATMKAAYDKYIAAHGGPHNRSEFGEPRGAITATTDKSWRRKAASDIRSALMALADRALNLKIATDAEYDSYTSKLKIEW